RPQNTAISPRSGVPTIKNIIVIGGGFAGLWAALGAARRLDELDATPDRVAITMVNRDPWHAIRVRNYENDISDARVKLAGLLDPVGISLTVGDVNAIDVSAQTITVETGGGPTILPYDRLVIAAGSRLHRPDIAGLADHGFSIDIWEEAASLDRHLGSLPQRPAGAGRDTVLIAGAGLTGIELACEMPDRLRGLGISDGRTILVDSLDHIGSDMGADAISVISEALSALGVETRTSVAIAAIDPDGATLADGSRIDSATMVWTAGVRPSKLAALVPASFDNSGRILVDAFMRVVGLKGVFAAGDIAAAPFDATRSTVMSCQHARPMGRFAGHNVVGDLLGEEMLPLNFSHYATCLDLGPWGSLYTDGRERRVVAKGMEVKENKLTTNSVRIYPPRTGVRDDLLAAAAAAAQPRARPRD
ncbi:MAG: NAD(P)/FAD-dependent oxidoreductase, partial [Alphaproteobacteria bacterium]